MSTRLLWALTFLGIASGIPDWVASLNAADDPIKQEVIDKSIDWYEVLPDADAKTPLRPQAVLRWRNVVRGQKWEDILVVWAHNGRPVAMASIFPWNGGMSHEFDSLSRDNRVIARENGRVIWSPATAGVEFKDVPGAPSRQRRPPSD